MFGPDQEEWKAAILAELQSFAKLGVYEVVTRAEVGGQEILPGRLVLVVKPNPEGEKGKKKARNCCVWQLSDGAPGRDDLVEDPIIPDAENVVIVGLLSGMAD